MLDTYVDVTWMLSLILGELFDEDLRFSGGLQVKNLELYYLPWTWKHSSIGFDPKKPFQYSNGSDQSYPSINVWIYAKSTSALNSVRKKQFYWWAEFEQQNDEQSDGNPTN